MQRKQQNRLLGGDLQMDETMWSHHHVDFYEVAPVGLHGRQIWFWAVAQEHAPWLVNLHLVNDRTTHTL